MATTKLSRSAGAPASGLNLGPGLRVAALAVVLAGFPLLAPNARAQQPAAIRARAYVTTSILAAAVRPESAPVATLASLQPATKRIRIPGVGTLDVQAGPGEAVRVGPRGRRIPAACPP